MLVFILDNTFIIDIYEINICCHYIKTYAIIVTTVSEKYKYEKEIFVEYDLHK